MTHRRGAISTTNAIFLFIIVAALGTVLVLRGGTGDPTQSDPVFQNTATYADAKAAAADQDKLVFVLATADWCGPCRSLRGGTLADPEVQAQLTAVAVPYKLDVTNEQLPAADAQLAAALRVSGIPALFVIDQNDNVVASAVGDMSATQFKNWLRAAAN